MVLNENNETISEKFFFCLYCFELILFKKNNVDLKTGLEEILKMKFDSKKNKKQNYFDFH